MNDPDNPWIKSLEELPPSDDIYEICSNPGSSDTGVAAYDGYGFIHDQVYVRPIYWRRYVPLQKKYGKIKHD